MQKRFFLYACLCLPAVLMLWVSQATAQQQNDSMQQQTIDIYNIYQPTLRAAAKLNLNTRLPKSSQNTPNLIYSIPSQSLYFSYPPVPLKPLAIGIDSTNELLYQDYIKAGFGNHSSPLIQLGLSNGKNMPLQYGLNFNYISSKGALEDQQFSKANLLLHGNYYTQTQAFHAEAGYDHHGIRYYGYDHSNPKPDDLSQAYNTVSMKVGMKNIKPNSIRLDYQPTIGFKALFDKYDRSETSFLASIPFQKFIMEDIFISAELKADLSKYTDNTNTFENALVSVHPAFSITKDHFKLHAGLNPTWSKGEFNLLPDIVNETDLIKDKLILSSGWIGYFDKNSYGNIVKENPFITDFNNDVLNTRIVEKYTGIKGSISNHITYNTKFSFINYHSKPLYLNNASEYNKFDIIEDTLKAFEFHAELEYTLGEKFKARINGSWYNYNDQVNQEKPWGLQPFTSNLYLQYGIKKLLLNANIYALSGSWYKTDLGEAEKTDGAFDINLGGSYEFAKQFSVWIQTNNILDNHYQRWNHYPSIGFNIMVGIMIKFNTPKDISSVKRPRFN